MFALATAVVALAAYVAAAPSPLPRTSLSGGSIPSLGGVSLSGWGGFSSLDGFDSFWGSSNFCGNNQEQVIIQQSVVCHSEEIVVIQQQFSILEEFAKRVLLEQICEVETQTIVWEQFVSSLSSFGNSFRHIDGRAIGYDHSIASHISGLVDSSDNIITSDFGFSGSDIGQNVLVPSGFNWDSSSSPLSVSQAQFVAQSAVLASQSSSFSSASFGGSSSSLGGFSGLTASPASFAVGAV